MAGPFDAGTVSARLILNLDEWSANLEKAKKDTSTFAGAVIAHKVEIEKLGKSFAVVGGAIVGSLGLMLKSATDFTLEAGRMSQKTGIAVETISGLREAASKTGVSMETLNVGLRRYATIASDAAAGNKAALETFAKLGITATDVHGKVKPMDQLLLETANKFKGMADGSDKAALAVDLFGRSGTEMIPMLNKGSDGIKEFMADAKDMGLVITKEGVAKAKAFSIAMGELDDAFMAIKLVIANALMPVVKGLADAFTFVGKMVRALMDVFPPLTSAITIAVGAFGGLATVGGVVLLLGAKLIASWATMAPAITGVATAVSAASAKMMLSIPIYAAVAAAILVVINTIDKYGKAQEAATAAIVDTNNQQVKTWKWIGTVVNGATTDMSKSLTDYIARMRRWGWDSEQIAEAVRGQYGKLIDKAKDVAESSAKMAGVVKTIQMELSEKLRTLTTSEYAERIYQAKKYYDDLRAKVKGSQDEAKVTAEINKAQAIEVGKIQREQLDKQAADYKNFTEKIRAAFQGLTDKIIKGVKIDTAGMTNDLKKAATNMVDSVQRPFKTLGQVIASMGPKAKKTFSDMAKDCQNWAKKSKVYVDAVREAFAMVASAINQISENNFQKESNRLDREYDKQRSMLDKEYAAKKAALDKIAADEAYAAQVKSIMNSSMTEAEKKAAIAALETERSKNEAVAAMDSEYAAAAAALEEKLAADKKALDIKAAESKKKAGITQAIIGTALAVVSALGTNPFIPMGIIAAALALVAGMAQIAIIKSAPIPMAEGGLVKQATHVIAGEAGPEAIMPMRELKRMLNLTPNAGGKTINVSVSAVDASGFDRLISSKMIPRLKRALTNESLTIPVKAVRG